MNNIIRRVKKFLHFCRIDHCYKPIQRFGYCEKHAKEFDFENERLNQEIFEQWKWRSGDRDD